MLEPLPISRVAVEPRSSAARGRRQYGAARLGWLLAVLAGCGNEEAPADPLPPAERQLDLWLDTFNAGDPERWQQFNLEHVSGLPMDIERDIALRERTGGLQRFDVEASSSTRTVARLKERDADATGVRLTLEVEPVEPHRITGLDLDPGIHLPIPVARLGAAELPNAITSYVEQRVERGQFYGTVLVTSSGDVVFSAARGLADVEQGVPIELDTRFRNGSINKMFTAVAVMTLVQSGRLQLDAALGEYLPDYPNPSAASSVTIHHLLTHTGGTGDFVGPEFIQHRLELRTHRDYIELFGSRELEHEPGSRWAYSNFGYIILGRVIETVSGRSYYEYVQEHVYDPAGMTATGSAPEEENPANVAVGYVELPGADALLPNRDMLPYRGTAAGGGYTSASDLLRFADALTNFRLLDRAHTELLVTGKVVANDELHAYGFFERVRNGIHSIGHGGNAPGMDADFAIYPELGFVVAVLSNRDAPAAARISEFIGLRLPVGP